MLKTFVDVIVYAPLEMEYKAAQSSFPPKGGREVSGNDFVGYIADIDDQRTILVVTGFEWGNDAARKILTEVFDGYSTPTAVTIGIAGALSDDAELGDVFYSKTIIDLTQRSKATKKGKARSKTTYDPVHHEVLETITKALDKSRLSVNEKSVYKTWQDACSLRNRGKLANKSFKSISKSPSDFETPVANNGQIASTDLPLRFSSRLS